MRKEPFSTGLAIALTCLAGTASAAMTLGRQYAFGFENGNLVRNWSFEQAADNWHDESQVLARFAAKADGKTAVSGSFVAKFNGTNSTGATINKLSSDIFPVEEFKQYTLSFYISTAAGNTASVHPVVRFYSNQSASTAGTLAASTGANYPVNSGWTLISFTSQVPRNRPMPGSSWSKRPMAREETSISTTSSLKRPPPPAIAVGSESPWLLRMRQARCSKAR